MKLDADDFCPEAKEVGKVAPLIAVREAAMAVIVVHYESARLRRGERVTGAWHWNEGAQMRTDRAK